MTNQIRPWEQWPSGDSWTVAFVDPNAVRRLGLEFEDGADDLDSYQVRAVADSRVGQFWLFRRRNSPHAGWELVVDAAVGRDVALAALERQLKLDSTALVWVNSLEKLPTPPAGVS